MKNWLGYAKHREAMEAAGNDHDAARAAEEAFSQAHGAQFSAKTVAEAWKTPERMRFDSMGRLLLGKLGNAIGAVHKFNAETERAAPGESAREAFARRQIHAGRLADVKACLRDWISFEQAQSQMKSALQEKDPDQARTLLRGAAQALAAVRDTDAQNLFSRDGRKQVEATELAKRMTIGERERYTMTNAGPAALAGLVNIGGAAASLGLNIEKVVAESHGISMPAQYGDQNDARTLAQGSAPVTAPYVAAERARFQKTRMGKTVKTLARKQDDHVALKLELPAGKPMAPNTDYAAPDIDQALDKLIGQLEDLRDIPDEIQLSIGGKALPSGKLSGTTGYLNWRYDNAPLQTKAKFQMRTMEMVADNLVISVASPIAQGIAQVPLSMTRAAAHRGNAMSADVRDRLTRLAGQPADPQPSPEHPPSTTQPVQQPVPQPEPPASPSIGARCPSPAGATPARSGPGARRLRPVRGPTRAERCADAGRRSTRGRARRTRGRRLPAQACRRSPCRSRGAAARHAGRQPRCRRDAPVAQGARHRGRAQQRRHQHGLPDHLAVAACNQPLRCGLRTGPGPRGGPVSHRTGPAASGDPVG